MLDALKTVEFRIDLMPCRDTLPLTRNLESIMSDLAARGSECDAFDCEGGGGVAMPNRSEPYYSFAYVIQLNRPVGSNALLGGFSEVTGLANIHFGYRGPVELRRAGGQGGIFSAGQPQKLSGMDRVNDVTLKRGVVNSSDLWSWILAARTSPASARAEAIVTLRNEAGQPVKRWKLSNATPSRYGGATLGGKGGTDVAIEELVLSAENIQIVPPR
jgi:phage tail-like protein